MVSRTLAGSLGLKGDWALGEDNWKDENDLNLVALSVFVQGRALDKVAVTPPAPIEGAVYIFDETHPTQPNKVAAYDEGAWKYFTPLPGFRLFNVALNKFMQFSGALWVADAAASGGTPTESIIIAVSDETTVITAGVAKVTFRMPYAFNLASVRASLTTASSSGIPTIDINEGGASILSTKLTIDATEKTSLTAAAPPVISDAVLANDAEITIDIDLAGTGAAGLKVYLIGQQ